MKNIVLAFAAALISISASAQDSVKVLDIN